MYLHNQYACSKIGNRNKKMSCLLLLKEILVGFDSSNCTIMISDSISQSGIKTNRKYYKMTYDERNKNYYCICFGICKGQRNIFILDDSFEEIDCITCCFETNISMVHDLYYDQFRNLLYLVTPRKIFLITLNGDNLGTFLTASMNRMYDCVCTLKDYVFIAYEEMGSCYIASYTTAGSYLEKISISKEYSICNMQVIPKNEIIIISIFAYKHNKYPYILEIMLEKNPMEETECEFMLVENEKQENCITCNVENY